MIELEGVGKSFDPARETWAVRDVVLHVNRGEFVVLLGESGSGKTTTLKMINRLVEPTVGTIRIEGEDHRKLDPVALRRAIGYAFQGIGLFPHMTVAQNVTIVPRLLRWSAADQRARGDELLNLVNLDPDTYRDRRVQQLSGGQKQRIGVARALAARPKVMLLDEPFGALDPLTRDELQREYRRIHEKLELTTVMVTHDMTEALLLADRIAVMRDARLLRVGTPHELLTDPQDDYVDALMQTPRTQAQRVEDLIEAGSES